MSLSKIHEVLHINKTAGLGMETTASYVPEPVRPQNSSNNQTRAKLPIFVGDELVTDEAKGMLMNKASSTHTTQSLTRPGKASLRDLPRLQTSFAPGLSAIDSSSSASSIGMPPAKAYQTTAPRQRFPGLYQSFVKRLEDWNMPGKPAQSTPGDSQDNGARGHDRRSLDAQQHPNRLPVVNGKTEKAVNSARCPNVKPFDITRMSHDWAVISPKRKARLQENPFAPNSYATASQTSLQSETAKDEGGSSSAQAPKTECLPSVPYGGDPGEPHSWKTVASIVLRASAGLPYPLAKIDKPVEDEGMLKFDVTWKPVFVAFAQIRGQSAATENLDAHLPTFAASKSCYDTRKDTAVPKAATTFGIKTVKSWEMALHNGERTLLLEVCFPNSLVEFKDLDGVETMNEARKLVVDTFGKTEGNRLLRIQPSR
ncbi:hypothetical protein PG993_014283 [Apiospora rasikravindrae]|uniref:Uncharacterized protein n=1 Tax=Apiospora rasikravindrae TaxID=990691 RepID=A0ABR1RM96_9PEZI